jgi:hypothetical protein
MVAYRAGREDNGEGVVEHAEGGRLGDGQVTTSTQP